MPFSPAQQKAIDTRNKNILVSASAGSGKTSVLVERLCKLVLEDRISIDSIVAMTFTEDAASEMKARLMAKLQQQVQDDYIQSQLALLETASICTIDSFCLSIVKTYYYALPITYKMVNNVKPDLSKHIFSDAYNEALQEIDIASFTELKMYFTSYGKNENDILTSIEALINTAMSKPDSAQWIQSLMNPEINQETILWFYQFFVEQVETMIEICKEMIDELEKPDDFIIKQEHLEKCLKFLTDKEYASFKKQFEIYFTTTPGFKRTINKVSYQTTQSEFRKKEEAITNALFDMDIYLKDHQANQKRIQTFCTLSLKTMELFAKKKREAEIIDYNDMEHFAYELLKQPMIQEEVRNKYQMILIDEFQDTNDLQENIILCFSRKNNVFRVGDIKQSIYGFRQAKPEIMQNHMQNLDENATLIVLDENYRSNKSIIEFNNDFYEKIMNSKLLGNNFVKEDIANVGTKRQEEAQQYPVRFLYTEYLDWHEKCEEDINKTKAKTLHKENIKDLIANDILEKHNSGVPFKDICILTREHGPQEGIKKALEAYDIPVLAEIDHGFYTNHAIQIVLSTVSALYDPNNDIDLVASLCSPIGNVSYEELANACLDKPRYTPMYKHIKDMPLIQEWRGLHQFIKEDISTLIRKIYAHNDFYYEHTTNQDKTNLDLFLEMATQYPNQNDIQGFIDQIVKDSKQDAVGEAYPYGKDADVVKIKTMHHSKGLQFPIVYILSKHDSRDKNASNCVLVDSNLGISFNGLTKDLKIKRTSLTHLAFITKKMHDELKEEMRVFYVATTRAEKELVIVDYIDDIENYKTPFSTRTILQKKSYTGWLLHTYCHETNPIISFDKKNQLYQRPEVKQNNRPVNKLPIYNKETKIIESQTASQAKVKLEWPEINLSKNTGALRGTLFHEIAAFCPFPYKAEDCQNYAKTHHYTLTKTDIDQLTSLNNCQEYQNWMKAHHEFECSYIIKKENAIIHGFMDLVTWINDEIWILDFKTDTIQNEQELINKYTLQLKTYKEALSQIETKKTIHTALYSFHLKKLIFLE